MNILIISFLSLISNIFLGRYRIKYRPLSFMWFVMIHASILVIIPLRIWLETPRVASLLFIGLAAIGQVIGSRFCAVKS